MATITKHKINPTKTGLVATQTKKNPKGVEQAKTATVAKPKAVPSKSKLTVGQPKINQKVAEQNKTAVITKNKQDQSKSNQMAENTNYIQKRIKHHKTAAVNFEAAAKHHHAAAKHIESDDFDKADHNTLKAVTHSKLAKKSQEKVLSIIQKLVKKIKNIF